MLFRLTFKDDGNTRLVAAADSRDILHWEREKSGRTAGKLSSNPAMEDFYSLAHCAARRAGSYSGSLREFEDAYRVVRVEEVVDDDTGEVDEGGPTQSGR